MVTPVPSAGNNHRLFEQNPVKRVIKYPSISSTLRFLSGCVSVLVRVNDTFKTGEFGSCLKSIYYSWL